METTKDYICSEGSYLLSKHVYEGALCTFIGSVSVLRSSGFAVRAYRYPSFGGSTFTRFYKV